MYGIRCLSHIQIFYDYVYERAVIYIAWSYNGKRSNQLSIDFCVFRNSEISTLYNVDIVVSVYYVCTYYFTIYDSSRAV